MMNLNASQMQAVRHFQGPCCVIAGPGSGKTAVITQRTYNLISEHQVDPGEILVVTFTKAAAMEMKQRFLALSGEERCRVTFGTFHAVFFTILKAAYHFEASNILTDEMKYQFMRDLIAKHHLEYRDENDFINNILAEISRVKNERLPLEHFYSGHCGEEVFRDLFREYDRKLRMNRLLDFDDMMVYTYELFTQRPDILAVWQKKYRYILVDEYQDINQLQFEIVRLLALPQNNLFIVGDDDQSIYRFRGSKPELMLRFPKLYPDCKKIVLDVNYRSDACIVEDALRLIAHNKERFAKHIHPNKPAKRRVEYLTFEDRRMQNMAILKVIADGVAGGERYGNYAILFRTNTQPRLLTEQLMEYGVPFTMKDRIPNLYEHWIARDIFTYMRIAEGSRARADFLQIMNRPKRYIGRDSLCDPLVDFVEWEKMYDEQSWIAERIEKLAFDVRMVSKMSPFAAINYIRQGIGYDMYLADYAAYRGVKVEELFEIADELLSAAKGYTSFENWWKHIEEYSAELKKQAKNSKPSGDAVVLATMHSAKGLEFEHVFIPDANEGIMPYKKAVLEKDIEEERRLFYVGMTRAKQSLTIGSVQSARDKSMEPSRFVIEAKG